MIITFMKAELIDLSCAGWFALVRGMHFWWNSSPLNINAIKYLQMGIQCNTFLNPFGTSYRSISNPSPWPTSLNQVMATKHFLEGTWTWQMAAKWGQSALWGPRRCPRCWNKQPQRSERLRLCAFDEFPLTVFELHSACVPQKQASGVLSQRLVLCSSVGRDTDKLTRSPHLYLLLNTLGDCVRCKKAWVE